MERMNLLVSAYLLLNITLLAGGSYAINYMHEEAHRQTFIYLGNVNATINVTYSSSYPFMTMETIPENNATIENYKEVMMLNSLNEIYGYQISNLYLLIVIANFCFSVINVLIVRDSVVQEYMKKLKTEFGTKPKEEKEYKGEEEAEYKPMKEVNEKSDEEVE